MNILSLETSSKVFSIAISRDAKVSRFRNVKSVRLLENSIIKAIDKICLDAKIKFEKIDAFAISQGPGSFTSLRVGLATVKAFCMATGKPLVGIGSLDVIAAAVVGKPCDEICVISDARRGKVYAAIFDSTGKRKGDYLLVPVEELLTQVQGRTLFVGDGLILYRKQIEETYDKYAKAGFPIKDTCLPAGRFGNDNRGCQAVFAPEKLWYPQAKLMAQLAYARLQRNDVDDAAKLLPIYLYAQDCQVQKS